MNSNINTPQPNKASGTSIASLCLGIAGFIINPLYLVNLAAIITGIVGIATAGSRPKGMAIAGLILGIVGAGVQVVLDIILTVFSFGVFGFSFCI